MLVPLERNLSPEQVDARLRQAHRARRTAERALAFYLKEVNDRRLFEAVIAPGSTRQETFETAHPDISIEVTDIPEDQYVTKIDTALAAGETPDIAFVYERRWLKAKYPASWDQYEPIWERVAERWRDADPGVDFAVSRFEQTMSPPPRWSIRPHGARPGTTAG